MVKRVVCFWPESAVNFSMGWGELLQLVFAMMKATHHSILVVVLWVVPAEAKRKNRSKI